MENRQARWIFGSLTLVMVGLIVGILALRLDVKGLREEYAKVYQPDLDWDWVSQHEKQRKELFAKDRLRVPKSLDGRHVILYDLTEREAFSKMSWTGFDIRYVVRARMDLLGKPPEDGYCVRLIGDATPPARVSATVAGKQEELTQNPKHPTLFQNDARIARHGPPPDEPEPSRRSAPKNDVARLFVNRKNREVDWVALTPPPIYEVDGFDKGRWVATYGVWLTEKEAKAAVIVEAATPTTK